MIFIHENTVKDKESELVIHGQYRAINSIGQSNASAQGLLGCNYQKGGKVKGHSLGLSKRLDIAFQAENDSVDGDDGGGPGGSGKQ